MHHEREIMGQRESGGARMIAFQCNGQSRSDESPRNASLTKRILRGWSAMFRYNLSCRRWR